MVGADHRVVFEQEFIGPNADAAGVLETTLARLIPSLQDAHIKCRCGQSGAAWALEIAHRGEDGAIAIQRENIQAAGLVFVAHGLDFHRSANGRRVR